MNSNIVRRLSIAGLSLVLTTGLLVGCSTGETDSRSANASEHHAEKQSGEHEHGHDQAEAEHGDHGHHDGDHHEEEGHEHGHEHNRAEHFEGKKAETYDEAVSNMSEANAKLEDLLAQDELGGTDFYKIHRMSYTMENALAKIREESDGNYEDVKQHLEAVHLASEKNDAETVRQDGQKYLEGARAMLEKE